MSGFDSGTAVPSQPDEAVVMPAAGAWGFFLGLLHLAIGGVALALAVDEGFASGKAVFGADVWRIVLGVVGAALALLAIRGLVRIAGAQRRTLTPELRRTAARRGRLLAIVGVLLLVTSVTNGFGGETIAFESWTKPFFITGAIYLALMGLSLQLDPSGPLRQQRLRQGYGAAGTATILRASDTGWTVNEAPQVQIEFRIESEGRTFEASDRIVMERAKLALLIPGSTVNVLVDRGDPKVFHVDWNSWQAPASGNPA
ncbi:MAG TPA: hypothetical protein VG318_08315 [Actinomycetota bacterium]|nr:hypothetical protein [Actinomycetota bacterium]